MAGAVMGGRGGMVLGHMAVPRGPAGGGGRTTWTCWGVGHGRTTGACWGGARPYHVGLAQRVLRVLQGELVGAELILQRLLLGQAVRGQLLQ